MTDSSAEPPVAEQESRTPFREWPAAGRWAVYLAVALVLALVTGFIGVAAVVRRSLPTYDGTASVDGLTAAVDVRRDPNGIATIGASISADLFRAQGYVAAQDRFFQMDTARHAAAGRLAELLGSGAVPADMVARVLGWSDLAQAEYPSLSAPTRSALLAYSAGVNEYLRSHTPSMLSMEYTLLELGGLNYDPEPWTPIDSLAILAASQGQGLSDLSAVRDEVDRSLLSVDRTRSQIAELYPLPAPAATDPVDPGTVLVAGSRSADGRPLLGTAPVAAATLPSPWYQVSLRCRVLAADCPYQVSGLSRPGVPGVLIGRTAGVAWSLGDSGVDVADLVLEKVQGHRYLHGGRWLPLAEHDEQLRIQGAPTLRMTVRSTRRGPLLSDVSAELSSAGADAEVPTGSPARDNGYAVAIAAPALQSAGRTADGVLALDRAQDVGQLRAAAATLAMPGTALSWAGATGGIGQQTLGPVPRRPAGDSGQYPVAGWLRRFDPTGAWLSWAQLPHTVDPASGVIAASPRARELIGTRDRVRPADLARVLTDTRSPLLDTIVPALRHILLPSGYDADGQRLLADWDGNQSADSAAAAYANVVWRTLLALLFDDQLPRRLWPDGSQRWITVVTRLLQQPNSPWWDDAGTPDVVEDRDTTLAEALREARDEMTRRVARDPGEWAWGRLHGLRLVDAGLGGRRLLGLRDLFDRGPYPAPGGPGTLAGGAEDLATGYLVTAAPAARLVVDLGTPDASLWIGVAGVSGHAFAEDYTDQTRLWLAGRFLAWPFSDAASDRASTDRLQLLPGR